jgi:hypothetical protein
MGVLDHEGQPIARVVGVEGQIGATGLEDAEDADHQIERALDAEADQHVGADTEARQVVREALLA